VGKCKAIGAAAAIGLRAIVMTMAAMVMAVVLLLLALGAGAARRFAIDRVIASGMTIGTLLIAAAVYLCRCRDEQARRPAASSVSTLEETIARLHLPRGARHYGRQCSPLL